MIVGKQLFVKNFILIIYCLAISGAAAYSLEKPVYNWDILPYMGVVLSYDKADVNIIHSEVYAAAKEQIPHVFFGRLVDSSNAYRNNAAQNPPVFHAQFPFYVVKPLYTGMAWLFYKAGVSLSLSTVWPSVIAYFFTGLVLFCWLKKYWSVWYSCAAGILIMLSPPLLTVAGLSTPDALSGLLVFTAVYFLTEKKSAITVFVFLVMAIFARLDNIIPAMCLLPFIFFTGKGGQKISAVMNLFLLSGLLLAYFIISAKTRAFGWSIFFYPAFIKQLNVSYTAGSSFDFAAYMELVKSQLATGSFFSFISVFFFLVLVLLRNTSLFSFNKLTMEQMLAIVFVVIIVVRFVLQPLIADRIYVPYYLSVIAFSVKKNSVIVSQQ